MEYRQLGRTEIEVSKLCLGTMTWGEQNTEAEGFEQMDAALDRGINFFDTAEMYPIAPREETYGRTEEIIGNWFQSRGNRDKVVLATKAVGPGSNFTYVRDGKPRLNKEHLDRAVEESLKRLKTDVIDLYQLHWPERKANRFGELGYEHDPDEEDWTPIEETLSALDDLVKSGKVRHVGLSNETAWGMMKFITLAEQGKGPRMVSVQNPYSLLNRSFEVGAAEVAIREDCGLLAYAPLAAGVLTGKYLDGARPEGARMTLFPNNKRYTGERAERATSAYVSLARLHGLDPAQMAIAYVASRPFAISTIIGATKMSQLTNDMDAADLTLSEEVLAGLEDLHKVYTYPCP